jgi:hypothetical protein
VVAIGSRYNDGGGNGAGHVRVYENPAVGDDTKTLAVAGSTLQVWSNNEVIQSCATGPCDLSGIGLTGTIPTTIARCTSLTWL